MDNQLMGVKRGRNKRFYLAFFIILGALIISGALLVTRNLNSKRNLLEIPAEAVKNSDTVEVKELKKEETSKQIPSELILEPDGKIIKSYESLNPDGKLLAVYEYVSDKDTDKTSAALLKILKNENWAIIDDIDQSQQTIFTADKDDLRVRLVIQPYTEEGKSRVFISSLQK